MMRAAQHEQPTNPIYHLGEPGNTELARQLLDANSPVRKILATTGALGGYMVDIYESWAHMTWKGY